MMILLWWLSCDRGSFGYHFFVSRKVAAKRSPTQNLLYLYYVKVIKFSMITSTNTQMKIDQYPFAQELITDTQGNIRKVIIDFPDYLRLLEVIEDEGLILAIKEVQQETPLNINEALAELERE
ncbi:hypothetical protein LC605_08015 [Nostoc sp. CHAB 5836]|uniref:hypothetical protein n=1 Tax=Nostoc sp. CHAB 5836 TaxID=2780404 RepID=UPI001E4125D7|nr:hypothetical protein [Nostoc sp. CHAB 5836]MCC5615023.1 hypothetical protein [Nostoc sp. CHAB 5836]